MGGWVLRTTADLDPSLQERLQDSFERFDRQWVEPMTASGFSELQVALLYRAVSAMLTELLRRWRGGTLEREEALAMAVRHTFYLIDGMRSESRD